MTEQPAASVVQPSEPDARRAAMRSPQEVSCPKCRAGAWQPCQNDAGIGLVLWHSERWAKARPSIPADRARTDVEKKERDRG